MPDKRKILFICTGNSCRSQMAEAVLRHLGGDRFDAHSAGTCPAGYVHPLALEAMRQMDIPTNDLVSKSWGDFTDTPFDAVITVCDAAAGETCPTWSGNPITAHWALPDPAYHLGTEEQRIEFALRVSRRLHTKIQGLVDLNWLGDRKELTKRLNFLGEI